MEEKVHFWFLSKRATERATTKLPFLFLRGIEPLPPTRASTQRERWGPPPTFEKMVPNLYSLEEFPAPTPDKREVPATIGEDPAFPLG